jgi:hypothetical protein
MDALCRTLVVTTPLVTPAVWLPRDPQDIGVIIGRLAGDGVGSVTVVIERARRRTGPWLTHHTHQASQGLSVTGEHEFVAVLRRNVDWWVRVNVTAVIGVFVMTVLADLT